jgi:hypothetical protein
MVPKSPICNDNSQFGMIDSDERRTAANLEDLWRVPVGPLEGGLID